MADVESMIAAPTTPNVQQNLVNMETRNATRPANMETMLSAANTKAQKNAVRAKPEIVNTDHLVPVHVIAPVKQIRALR